MEHEGYKTRMKDCGGPFYPNKIEDLNKIFKKALDSESFKLEETLAKIDGFEKVGFVGQSNGISWKMLSITRGEKEIFIYFPLKFEGATSVTFYAKKTNEDEIERVVDDLVRLLGKESLDAEKQDKKFNDIIENFSGKNTVGKILGFFKKN